MTEFIPSEQKRRHQFIDQSIENYRTILLKSQKRETIHPLLSSAVESHTDILNNLLVPNLRNGVLELSRRALKQSGETFIPITAIYHGEAPITASPNLLTPHPIQAEQAKKYLEHHSTTNDEHQELLAEYHAAGIDDTFIINPPDSLRTDTSAYVTRANTTLLPSAPASDPYVFSASGRPMMVLTMNQHADQAPFVRSGPDTIGHEVTHVSQTLMRPIQRLETFGDIDDHNLSRELEAYGYESSIFDELLYQKYRPHHNERPFYTSMPDGTPYSRASIISFLERAINPEHDRYAPTPELRKKLAEVGLSIHNGLPEDYRSVKIRADNSYENSRPSTS